ncbi:MAG: hypothetical protein Q9215_001589 [Flavoplaca cf. flavocitrina]
MSFNSSTSPAHLRIPENRFALSPDTPVNRNANNEGNGLGPGLSQTDPSGLDRLPTEGPHRGTAYPRSSYSPGSIFDDSPIIRNFDEAGEEQTIAATTTTPLDPPKAPGYPFGPPPLEVANPDNDPDINDAIYVFSKIELQALAPNQAAEGNALPADFAVYRKHVDGQFAEARRIVAKSMQEKKSLERQHARQRAAWQDELERARVAANRWTRPIGAKVRVPRLISDQEIEAEAYHSQSNGYTESTHEELPFAESEKHPPLYNDFPDHLRQMAVELLVQRSKVAYTLKDWKSMETSSRQAYNLARSFDWEPYIARSAFWIGIALYHRKNWTEAYEAFEEADKTNGYYIARRIILHWLSKTSKRLEGSPGWSSGLSAIRGENPPVLTPLDTVIEEVDALPIPNPGDQYRIGKQGVASTTVATMDDLAANATEIALLADDQDQRPNAEPKHDGLGRNPSGHHLSASPKDRRVKPAPKAIKLSSIVEPPTIRTPRLYEPQPSGGVSVAGKDDLSLPGKRQPVSMPSESEAFIDVNQKGESRSEDDHRTGSSDPANLSKKVSVRSNQQPPLSDKPSDSSKIPSPSANQIPNQSPGLPSQQEPPSNISLPSSPSSVPSKTPPLSPTSFERQERRIALTAQRRLEDSKIEAAIRNVKAVASPRIASAKSASARYSQAPWSKPLGWTEKADRYVGRSQSVRSVGAVRGVSRGGRRPGLATRVSDSAVLTIAGTPVRVRERRSRFGEMEGWGED